MEAETIRKGVAKKKKPTIVFEGIGGHAKILKVETVLKQWVEVDI